MTVFPLPGPPVSQRTALLGESFHFLKVSCSWIHWAVLPHFFPNTSSNCFIGSMVCLLPKSLRNSWSRSERRDTEKNIYYFSNQRTNLNPYPCPRVLTLILDRSTGHHHLDLQNHRLESMIRHRRELANGIMVVLAGNDYLARHVQNSRMPGNNL